jgi:hypothetical protein
MDKDKGSMSKVGIWAFIIGLVLAVILALVSAFGGAGEPAWAIAVLGALGILVGLLNITASEVQKFLIAAIALIVSLGKLNDLFDKLAVTLVGTTAIWGGLGTFVSLVTVFMAPAAVVVAIQALFQLARD